MNVRQFYDCIYKACLDITIIVSRQKFDRDTEEPVLDYLSEIEELHRVAWIHADKLYGDACRSETDSSIRDGIKVLYNAYVDFVSKSERLDPRLKEWDTAFGVVMEALAKLRPFALSGAEEPSGELTEEDPQYVTLDQMASIVNRSKRTLERRKTNGDLPEPDVEGGGGRPDEWRWDRIRPWLESEYRRGLPERFPRMSGR